VAAIGQLLQRTIRQSDSVAQTGEAEFTLATGSVTYDSAHNFAQRLCSAIAHANLVKDDRMAFVASCGLASLSEKHTQSAPAAPMLMVLRDIAHRRAVYGLNHTVTGVIGIEEENSIKQDGASAVASSAAPNGPPEVSATIDTALNTIAMPSFNDATGATDVEAPDLATLLKWIKEGKQDSAMQHIGKLSVELQPLVDLMLKQTKD
jgi:hypothetical protein